MEDPCDHAWQMQHDPTSADTTMRCHKCGAEKPLHYHEAEARATIDDWARMASAEPDRVSELPTAHEMGHAIMSRATALTLAVDILKRRPVAPYADDVVSYAATLEEYLLKGKPE